MKRLVGERRALSAAVLAFYGFVYLLLFLLEPMGPEWDKALAAMAGVYGMGFVGVVAGYFWARWYAIGLGLSGVITSVVSMWQLGPEPVMMFWGGTHALVALTLWGDHMAEGFDGRAEWRARFHMDEYAVHRLGRSVIRIGISLPYILLYALAPRVDGMSDLLLGALTLGFAGAGTYAVFRMRTWGLAALAAAAAVLTVGAFDGGTSAAGLVAIDLGGVAAMGAGLLALAIAPFAGPALRFLTARRI